MEGEQDDTAAIVLDVGSGSVKAGFCGDEKPSAVFPTVVGRPKKGKKQAGGDGQIKDHYVGNEAE